MTSQQDDQKTARAIHDQRTDGSFGGCRGLHRLRMNSRPPTRRGRWSWDRSSIPEYRYDVRETHWWRITTSYLVCWDRTTWIEPSSYRFGLANSNKGNRAPYKQNDHGGILLVPVLRGFAIDPREQSRRRLRGGLTQDVSVGRTLGMRLDGTDLASADGATNRTSLLVLTFIDHTPVRVTLYHGQSVTVCCNAHTIKFSFVNRKTLVLWFEKKICSVFTSFRVNLAPRYFLFVLCVLPFTQSPVRGCRSRSTDDTLCLHHLLFAVLLYAIINLNFSFTIICPLIW